MCASVGILLGCGGAQELRLRHVVLYQNGIGYFERSGEADGDVLSLRFRAHEVDDVIKTLTVIGEDGASALSAVVPDPSDPVRPDEDQDDDDDDGPEPVDEDETTTLEVHLGGSGRSLTVTYAVPTPAWRAVYRVVLADEGQQALLQAWAVVYNASGEDWEDVQLTLATGAPFTYAIDLRSPRFVARPDITGELVTPVIHGPVRSSQTRGQDRDNVPDAEDQCPTEDEDADGFEDSDGCPDPDNDQDRILDVDDQCPNEPETYNGIDDDDGCPDRGQVIVEENQIIILDKIYFENRATSISARSQPILDAVAATLNGNPQITSVMVQGHAAQNEQGAWAISAARADAVRQALAAAGVSPSRLQARPFGNTQRIDPGSGESGHARNRRVEFQIEQAQTEQTGMANRGDDTSASPAPPPRARAVTVDAVESSASALALPSDAAGGTSYTMSRAVTIPAGSSTLVPILNERIPGRDVLFYRPDNNTPDSETHPFRAARIENTSGMRLVDGPVALFARGTFVGEGVLGAVNAGENSLIPYAVDGSTTVLRHGESERRPNRLVSIARGVMTVEDWDVQRTRYEIRAGSNAPSELILHHRGRYGYDFVELPPGAEESGTATLIPLPIRAGRDSELIVEERRPARRTVLIVEDSRTALEAYVHPQDMEPELRRRITEVLTQRTALAQLDEQVREVREQSNVASQRLAELQGSLRSIERSGAGAADLRRQLQGRLRDATDQSEGFATRLAELTANRAEARVRLSEMVTELHLEEAEE